MGQLDRFVVAISLVPRQQNVPIRWSKGWGRQGTEMKVIQKRRREENKKREKIGGKGEEG